MPPPDFVARRNALVRELKADGRSDDAKAVGALRRPRLSEYALNAAVREDDALGQRFATAVADATAAQSAAIGGGGAEAMRAATRELRAATTALIEAAGRQIVQLGSGGDQWDEIEQLLRSLANRPGVELLRAGLVGSSVVDPDDLFAGAPEPPDLPAPASRATTGATTRSRGRTAAPAKADSDGQGGHTGQDATPRRRPVRHGHRTPVRPEPRRRDGDSSRPNAAGPVPHSGRRSAKRRPHATCWMQQRERRRKRSGGWRRRRHPSTLPRPHSKCSTRHWRSDDRPIERTPVDGLLPPRRLFTRLRYPQPGAQSLRSGLLPPGVCSLGCGIRNPARNPFGLTTGDARVHGRHAESHLVRIHLVRTRERAGRPVLRHGVEGRSLPRVRRGKRTADPPRAGRRRHGQRSRLRRHRQGLRGRR